MGYRILLVDDNLLSLELATDLLLLSGHETLQARNAEEGIRLARQEKPDLILMDVTLPGMDGYEAARLLAGHSETAGIPVVAVTGHDSPDHRRRAHEAGCVGFLTKPIHLRTFATEVTGFLTDVESRADAP